MKTATIHQSTDDLVARLDEAVAFVQQRWGGRPALGIVAGSGLSTLGTMMPEPVEIPYSEIPHMPAPSVGGHAGELVLGELEGLPVAVLSGRVHLYEGHPPDVVVFGVRLLARLGAEAVVLTNAAGGVVPSWEPGDLCLIEDHINLTAQNPLLGANDARLGPRFPDMSAAYDPALNERMARLAAPLGLTLHRGVYAGLLGPSYETPAEIRMLRTIGASLVGMSTVLEAIALNHAGCRVGGVSVVTNKAAGVIEQSLHHDDVKDAANIAGPKLLSLLRELARSLAEEPLS